MSHWNEKNAAPFTDYYILCFIVHCVIISSHVRTVSATDHKCYIGNALPNRLRPFLWPQIKDRKRTWCSLITTDTTTGSTSWSKYQIILCFSSRINDILGKTSFTTNCYLRAHLVARIIQIWSAYVKADDFCSNYKCLQFKYHIFSMLVKMNTRFLKSDFNFVLFFL